MAKKKQAVPPSRPYTAYDVSFHWLPRLDGAAAAERIAAYGEILRRYRPDWTPTQESLVVAHLPADHLRDETLDGVPGWIVRIEFTREEG